MSKLAVGMTVAAEVERNISYLRRPLPSSLWREAVARGLLGEAVARLLP